MYPKGFSRKHHLSIYLRVGAFFISRKPNYPFAGIVCKHEDRRKIMHDEEQQLQSQQPSQQETLDPQLLSRVKQIIARRNTEFILDHQNDSLEQLSAYLKACMDDIGHPPARVEVIGGAFLEYRFGSWTKALRSFYSGSVSANLKNPPPFANRKIVRDLYAALDSQFQRADAACTKEVRA